MTQLNRPRTTKWTKQLNGPHLNPNIDHKQEWTIYKSMDYNLDHNIGRIQEWTIFTRMNHKLDHSTLHQNIQQWPGNCHGNTAYITCS